MRSLGVRYRIEKDKEPLASDSVIFHRAVKNQKFTVRIITTWFNKLVDKNDYEECEKKEIIEFLVGSSNEVRRTE